MKLKRRVAITWLSVVCSAAGCARRPARPIATAIPELAADVLGTFDDDYGIRYRIDAERWQQGERTMYLVTSWHAQAQYLIARNAPTNPSAPDKWTRIDWMPLHGMPPYTWAYCLSAYDAPTRDVAEATRVAKRDSPKSGCNGFPFSRMKRAE